MSTIARRLTKLFKEDLHRVVLWYGNDSAEMAAEFDSLTFEGVQKRKVVHNALATKFEVMAEAKQTEFLLFVPGKSPENDADNWLLDLQLAFPVFSTDENAIYREELDLDRSADRVIKRHAGFFTSQKRRAALKKHLPGKMASERDIELGVFAAILNCEPRITELFLALISAYTKQDKSALSKSQLAKLNDRQKVEKELAEFGMLDLLWSFAEKSYGYKSESPSIEDFVNALFMSELAELLPNQSRRVKREADLLLTRWRDSGSSRLTYERVARKLGRDWKLTEQFSRVALENTMRKDIFIEIDQRLLSGIRDGLLQQSIVLESVNTLISDREGTFWYDEFTSHYAALRSAATFFDLQRNLHLRQGVNSCLDDYTSRQYKIDQAYREFYYNFGKITDQLLQPLVEQVERFYTTKFLHPLNHNWQEQLDKEGYPIPGLSVIKQRDFYRLQIEPYVERGNRIFVIISDALRYESAVSLHEWLPTRNRCRTELVPMLATVPTFTQLGMAALLPHKTLELRGDGYVLADGMSTQGTANRDKILKAATSGRAVAITAPDFLRDYSSVAAGRAWVKEYDVIYIYQNLIDQAGESEEDKLFERTEQCFVDIEQLVKVIARMNGTNIIVTADHGYLFQESSLKESDYASFKVKGEEQKYNRRFVLGDRLEDHPGSMHYTASELGLEGELEVVIPKSVHRLRRSGSGSRYVHGGLSLQELLIPLLKVNIGRTAEDDVQLVDIEVLAGRDKITNNQYGVRFFQKQAATGKRGERRLRIGFYDLEGRLISNEEEVTFNSESTEERNRETKIHFRFGADATSGEQKEITLRLKDSAGVIIVSHPFTLDITFGNDFDY